MANDVGRGVILSNFSTTTIRFRFYKDNWGTGTITTAIRIQDFGTNTGFVRIIWHIYCNLIILSGFLEQTFNNKGENNGI